MALDPNTKYRARARSWEIAPAKTGRMQIRIEFDVLDADRPETITYFGGLTIESIPYTVEAMRACGWEGFDLDRLETLGKNEVQLVLKEEEWQGKPQVKVKYVNPLGAKNALAGDELRSFAAEMRGTLMALDPKRAEAEKARSTVEQHLGPVSDDIPF